MAESARTDMANSAADQASDPAVHIASLRRVGADRLDPVRFHFIETLAKRAREQTSDVRHILHGKLMELLAAYRERLQRTHRDAAKTIALLAEQRPDVAKDLQCLLSAGDLTGVGRLVAGLERSERHASLADLTRHLNRHFPEDREGRLTDGLGSRSELKTMQYFRNTWSILSAKRQVTEAIRQAPENAGPLNSHKLVVRSLALMRDISPDYLNRFVSYVDTLLWLDQTDQKKRLRISRHRDR